MSGNSLETRHTDDSDNVPVSSENFELWIRMATDNKINTSNTWNFALIDYFHDFNVLREGDGVNFQKASTTLDGCMKIYSHRIDSAAKDTGTLLSSLNIKSNQNLSSSRPGSSNNPAPTGSGGGTSNRNTRMELNDDDDLENQNDEDSEGGLSDDAPDDGIMNARGNSKSKSKSKKKKNTFLASSFNTIKIKDQDRPVKPDPVFKNALANFDEGGAKSLLNNILRLSKESKVVFDIAEDTELIIEDESEDEKDGNIGIEDEAAGLGVNEDFTDTIDINSLKRLVDFDIINHSLDVCPSLKELNQISNGKTDPTNLLEYMDDVDVSRIENDRRLNIEDHINENFDENAQPDFGNDVDVNMGGSSDNNENNNESEKMSNVSKRTQYSLYIDGVEDPDESGHNITFTNLFDENRQREQGKIREKDQIDATKPDKTDIDMIKIYDSIGTRPRLYWKIARLKRSMSNNRTFNDIEDDDGDINNIGFIKGSKKHNARAYNKKKDVVSINFLSDNEDLNEEEIFTSTEYLSKIMLTEKERKSGRHLLDSDAPFTAKRLAFLNTKPNQLIKSVLMQKRKNTFEERELDNIPASEEFFAQAYRNENDDILNDSILSDPVDHLSSFNDNDDYDPNGIEGFEVPLPNPFEEQPQNTENLNAHPQTLYRTNAISYAKRSKKVDVKLLKQNIWNSIEEISIHKKKRAASHFEEEEGKGGNELNKVQEHEGTPLEAESSATRSEESTTGTSTMSPPAMDDFVDDGEDIDSMQFTNVVEKMSSKYNTKTKRDLSTSFCFICLLHLANEQGLTLETLSNNEDIIIHK
ncbi:hypothetical protein PMKS-000385 [Pichia membranifaciens]|uniref:Condensin complex subunit 2 n=1 Tax=Pichia membranifaciens TaxID=4926 RepID=A0A1Q2YBL3_9ASCO|nr:hypothetical protein PMKS-000385 [Pichia membranifaciens]